MVSDRERVPVSNRWYSSRTSGASPVSEEVFPDHDEGVSRPGPARNGVALPLRHRPGPVRVPHGAGVAGALVPSQVEVVFAPGGGRESFDQSYAVQQDFKSEMMRLSAKRVSLLSIVVRFLYPVFE